MLRLVNKGLGKVGFLILEHGNNYLGLMVDMASNFQWPAMGILTEEKRTGSLREFLGDGESLLLNKALLNSKKHVEAFTSPQRASP